MQNLIFGDTADECLIKTIKSLNKHGLKILADGEYHYFLHPVAICLTNPLARFSFIPHFEPRESIILGICALAGVNTDDFLSGLTFKPFLPGPYLRNFDSEPTPYQVPFKTAGARRGKLDQLANATQCLQSYLSSFTVSLLDPIKGIDVGSGVAVSLRFYFDREARLTASVYVPDLDVIKQLVGYIIPIYTFIHQIVAAMTDKPLGMFYILSDKVHYAESDFSQYILGFSPPRLKDLRTFQYTWETKYDLRYVDFVIQHFVDFARRIRKGDVLVDNPFPDVEHLGVFSDYAEALRHHEAIERKISFDGKLNIRHPQLKHYYNSRYF